MSDKKLDYEEIMMRLVEPVSRGGWAIVEAYLEFQKEKIIESLIIERDEYRLRQYQGELVQINNLLKLKEDVLGYAASDETSAPVD